MWRLGVRPLHQYQNHDRISSQLVVDRGWIQRAREERGFVPVKNRFGEVEAAFAAPVTAGVNARWCTTLFLPISSKMRMQWVPANLTYLKLKPAIRSSVAAWVCAVLFCILASERVIGPGKFWHIDCADEFYRGQDIETAVTFSYFLFFATWQYRIFRPSFPLISILLGWVSCSCQCSFQMQSCVSLTGAFEMHRTLSSVLNYPPVRACGMISFIHFLVTLKARFFFPLRIT
jgi:hypothetical protein